MHRQRNGSIGRSRKLAQGRASTRRPIYGIELKLSSPVASLDTQGRQVLLGKKLAVAVVHRDLEGLRAEVELETASAATQ